MADYEIGNIMLNFKVQSNNISNSINKIVKSFNKLKDINVSNLKSQFDGITNAIKPFLNEIKSAEPALQSFGDSLDFKKVYFEIEKINAKLETIKSKSAASQIIDTTKIAEANAKLDITNQKLEQAKLKTQAIADKNTLSNIKIETANAKLKKANSQLEITNNRLNRINNTSDKTSISLNKVFNLGRIYFWINYTKRAAQTIANMMTSAINFDETLNKFQVSMGNYYERSIKFVNSLTYAFNLSTNSIMNYQSTFKNMLDAIGGLNQGDTSYQLSETLTRMAIDYASLFNVSIDSAMQQFQSTLSGQIRSIRTTSGYDVSEASIYALYQSIGGTKTMRQLDQVEKRLLRILVIQKQMSNTGAVGDFEKTINNTANVLKQMSETWQEIGRWIGQLTMVYLRPFLEKFLGFSIALREILKSINVMQGYQYENLGKGGMFGSIEQSAENAENAVESLKTILLGFDKLNILGNTSTSVLMPDYSLLTNQIAKYQSSLDKVNNASNKIATKLLEWLGYHKEINMYVDEQGNEIENISWVLNDGLTKIDLIKASLAAISSILVSISAMNFLNKITQFTSNIGLLSGKLGEIVSSPLTQAALLVTGMALAFKEMYETNEEFRKSVDETVGKLKDLLYINIDIENFLKLIKEDFQKIVKFITENLAGSISYQILGLLDSFAAIIQLIKGDFKGALESLGNVWENVWKSFDTLFGTKLFKFFTETIPNFFKTTLPQAFNQFINYMVDLGTTIGLFFVDIWEKFKNWLKKIPNWFNENIWHPIGNFFINIFEKIVNVFIDTINFLTSKLSSLWTWIGIDAIEQIDRVQFQKLGTTNKNVDTSNIVQNGSANSTNENNLSLFQSLIESNLLIKKAIEESNNRVIELNGRKVSEAIYDDLKNVAIRKGYNLSNAN